MGQLAAQAEGLSHVVELVARELELPTRHLEQINVLKL
jgi:hypothetical protein